jgi:hypothetical protein
MLDKRRIRKAVATNKVGTKAGSFNYFVRATLATREFGNSSSGSVAVNLGTSHDEVANGKGFGRARFIGSFTVNGATSAG